MKVHSVKKARQDYWKKGENGEEDSILIPKGTPYFWWKYKNKPRTISKTYPTKEQLTSKYGRPEFESKYDDFSGRVEDCDYDDRDDLRDEIEEYKNELQERLDNMPEQLQDSSVLNEYIEQLDGLTEDLEE